MKIYFWVLCSVPLSYVFIFMPVPYFLIIVALQYSLISGSIIPHTLFFLKICLAMWRLLWFHVHLSASFKKDFIYSFLESRREVEREGKAH